MCLITGTTENAMPVMLNRTAKMSSLEIDFLSTNSVRMIALTI